MLDPELLGLDTTCQATGMAYAAHSAIHSSPGCVGSIVRTKGSGPDTPHRDVYQSRTQPDSSRKQAATESWQPLCTRQRDLHPPNGRRGQCCSKTNPTPGPATALGHEAGVQNQQLPLEPSPEWPWPGARRGRAAQTAHMDAHRQTTVVLEVSEVDAPWQPPRRQHQMANVGRLQSAIALSGQTGYPQVIKRLIQDTTKLFPRNQSGAGRYECKTGFFIDVLSQPVPQVPPELTGKDISVFGLAERIKRKLLDLGWGRR